MPKRFGILILFTSVLCSCSDNNIYVKKYIVFTPNEHSDVKTIGGDLPSSVFALKSDCDVDFDDSEVPYNFRECMDYYITKELPEFSGRIQINNFGTLLFEGTRHEHDRILMFINKLRELSTLEISVNNHVKMTH